MNRRWYDDPVTGLPTIRRHPDARNYPSPDDVKNMVSGRDNEFGACPTCGGPVETCGHYDAD